MTTKTQLRFKDKTKVTHAVTARGAKIIRRTKDDSWYLKRGKTKIALTLQEAACVAMDGYIIRGLKGGEAFERIVVEMWSRSVSKAKKSSVSKKRLSAHK